MPVQSTPEPSDVAKLAEAGLAIAAAITLNAQRPSDLALTLPPGIKDIMSATPGMFRMNLGSYHLFDPSKMRGGGMIEVEFSTTGSGELRMVWLFQGNRLGEWIFR